MAASAPNEFIFPQVQLQDAVQDDVSHNGTTELVESSNWAIVTPANAASVAA